MNYVHADVRMYYMYILKLCIYQDIIMFIGDLQEKQKLMVLFQV